MSDGSPIPDEFDPARRVHAVREVLLARRFSATSEVLLHAQIEQAFKDAGLPFVHEARLTSGDRIDFLLHYGVGVEVKVKGTVGDVGLQLARYAECDEVAGLLLVTTRYTHAELGGLSGLNVGKPLRVLHLLTAF